MTATPEERISPASLTVASDSGRRVAQVEILSEKTWVAPASARESSCASRHCRAVEARAYTSRTSPTGSASALAGRGNSIQTRTRLAYGGDRHAEHLRELEQEAEAGGVVSDGHLALASPARRVRRGCAVRVRLSHDVLARRGASLGWAETAANCRASQMGWKCV